MATATADKPKIASTDDLFLLLADASLPVAEVLAKVPELALAKAWAAGDVEFGRLKHCVTGRPGVPESQPTLVIESEIDWSGPKTPRHGRLSAVLADARRFPACTAFKKYVKQVSQGKDDQGVERWKTVPDAQVEEGQEFRWGTAAVTKAEAEALMAMSVRLTDKGLASLQA